MLCGDGNSKYYFSLFELTMPIYKYKCKSCGHEFEEFRMVSNTDIPKCEKCGSEVKKIFGRVGVKFKGSGFYENDYKKKDKPKQDKYIGIEA